MNCTIDADFVSMVRSKGAIFLSPHYDDVCFSLGVFAGKVGRGTLLNVFNRSDYLPVPPKGLEGPVSEELVAKVRSAEDVDFSSRAGLTRIQLNFREPGLLGRSPKDMSGLEEDIHAVESGLLSALAQLVESDATMRPFLFAPMAVGQHVNHHAVHQVIVRNFEVLRKQFRIGFYEDLPYARSVKERSRTVARFRATQPGREFQRHTLSTGWSEKKEWVLAYPSQFRRDPGKLKFRPASIWPLSVHEALWMGVDGMNFCKG